MKTHSANVIDSERIYGGEGEEMKMPRRLLSPPISPSHPRVNKGLNLENSVLLAIALAHEGSGECLLGEGTHGR